MRCPYPGCAGEGAVSVPIFDHNIWPAVNEGRLAWLKNTPARVERREIGYVCTCIACGLGYIIRASGVEMPQQAPAPPPMAAPPAPSRRNGDNPAPEPRPVHALDEDMVQAPEFQ